MPPPRWTTPDQTVFLEERKPEYLKSKKDSLVLGRFFSKCFKDWFDRFPEQLGLNTIASSDTLDGSAETTDPTTSAATELQKTKDTADIAEAITTRKRVRVNSIFIHSLTSDIRYCSN
jgi:hypothetical protein